MSLKINIILLICAAFFYSCSSGDIEIEILEKVMLQRKNIHPNVDFPCGPTYYMMGIDIDFYTPIFVMSRITGWSAHIMEQHASNKLIRPLSKYRGAEVREVMLLNQR